MTLESIPGDSYADLSESSEGGTYPSRGFVVVRNPRGCADCGEGDGVVTMGSLWSDDDGSMTDGFATNHIARAICRQLGYSTGTTYISVMGAALGESRLYAM